MNTGRTVLLAGIAATLAACAGMPTGPSVMVLPGTGKSLQQFQTEDARCRQAAASDVERARGGTVSDQKRYDMAYMQCMYAEGNQIPVSSRSPGYSAPAASTSGTASTPSEVPPPPAGTPPPPPARPSR